MIEKFARSVFIDSEINSGDPSALVSKLNFPPSAFSVSPGEQMRLTLTSFEARRNWYPVNQTNNTFFWFDGATNTYLPCVIAPGNYETFGLTGVPSVPPAPPLDMVSAVLDAILQVPALAGTTAFYTPQTRKYTITLPGGLPAGSKFVSFQVKQLPGPPAGVSEGAFFNDSAELLGGFPTRDNFIANQPIDLFSGSSTPGLAVVSPQISPFVCALNTLEAIYIRTNLHSGNYQTYSFEKDLPNQSGLTPTQIFARIPLSRAYFDEQFEFLSFEDPNNLFQMDLNQTQLSQVYFSLTDDKGRPLQEVFPGQSASGNLSFKMSFKWIVLIDELPPNDRALQAKNLLPQYPHQVMNGR